MKYFYTFIAIFLISACSTVNVNKPLPGFQYLSPGTSLKDFVKDYGPPFMISKQEDGIELVYYFRVSKTSPAVWVPVVNLVASGNTNAVQKNVLKFDANDKFETVISTEQKKNFTSMYLMAEKEGMTGSGGRRNNFAFSNVGEYLAQKRIFFNQELWKAQNASNNYWNK